MQGSIISILQTLITGTVGVVLVAVGVQGFWKVRCTWWERILAFGGGLLMIDPGFVTDIIGIACAVVVVLVQLQRKKNTPSVQLNA
jgi:TRAP-type uncharacterized transport system fused permease subunit